MKKKLLTLTAGLALASAPLAAQADTPTGGSVSGQGAVKSVVVHDKANDVTYKPKAGYTPRATKKEVDMLRVNYTPYGGRVFDAGLTMTKLDSSTMTESYVRWGLEGTAILPNGRERRFYAYTDSRGALDSFSYAYVGQKECEAPEVGVNTDTNQIGMMIDLTDCVPRGTRLKLRAATQGESSKNEGHAITSYTPSLKDFSNFRTLTLS